MVAIINPPGSAGGGGGAPAAHAASHAAGGGDDVTPVAIGAVPTSYRTSVAEQQGYIASGFDPAVATSATGWTSGSLYVARLYVPKAATVTNVVVVIATLGSGLTAGQNLAGLYTDAGAQLSTTADQSTAWNTTGTKVMPLVQAQQVAADTFVRVVILAVGTTPPQPRSGSGSAVNANAGLASAAMRTAVSSAGQTTLPGNINTGTLVAYGSFWVGLT